MSLAPGTVLDGYRIIELIGAGGMGEVYRAHDTRLDREVALKLLPSHARGDEAAFARFTREARAVAALSHPNILAVHDFGQTPSASYVVFELLQGASLRDRLAEGPFPVRKAIDYSRQIADGLAAAHARNITHRDIKPDNLFVTADGRVKILDFGLAQVASPVASDSGGETTIAQPLTGAGTVMGTAGYMAPEQVRGQALDHRVDIFALGCVLFEMCTGRRAFRGATPADTITAVLSSDPPDLGSAGTAVPPALERIVRRCLEKAPGERFQSAHDLAFALDTLASGSGDLTADAAGPPAARGRRMSSAVVAGVALATLLVGLTIGAVLGRRNATDNAATEAHEAPLRSEFAMHSPGIGQGLTLAASPDGRYLAYSDTEANNPARSVFIRDLGTGTTEVVPGSVNGYPMAWSPRSDELLYSVNRTLQRFRRGSRSATILHTFGQALRGAVWLADDTIVFAVGGNTSLMRMPIHGGEPTPVVPPGNLLFTAPATFGSRTDYVLVTMSEVGSATNRQVSLVRLSDGQVTPLLANDASAHFIPGYLVLPRATGLFVVPFDEQSMTVTGPPALAGEPIVWDSANGGTSLTIGGNVVAFLPGRDRKLQFEWVDATGQSIGTVGPPGFYGSFALARDGTRLVVRQINETAERTVLGLSVIDLNRGVSTPVAVANGALSDPVWNADGSLLYRLDNTLLRQMPNASATQVLRSALIYPDNVSPDGKWLLGGQPGPKGGFGLYLMPADGSGEPRSLADTSVTNDEASFSPDATLISYHSVRNGRPEILLSRFPVTDERWQVSPDGGLQPRWSADGRTLYYIRLDGRMMRVRLPNGQPDQAGGAEPLFDTGLATPSISIEQYAVRGDRFLLLRPVKDATTQSIAVVSNWRTLVAPPSSPRP